MHNSAHHAGADNHTDTDPDRLAFADGGADTDAHASADIDGQPEPGGNSQPCGKHLTATVRHTHRLPQRRR